MILTDLSHLAEQVALTPELKKGLEYLSKLDVEHLSEGRIPIDGERVYVVVLSYDTKPPVGEPNFEVHRKYIDVQYLVSGEETIGWTHTTSLTETVPYNEAKDVWFGTAPAAGMSVLRMAPGKVAVFYPTDGHYAKLAVDGPSRVLKVVVKAVIGS